MKKSTISLAVAATVATSAAVHAEQYVNPGKTGQVLLFPFYNADNGNSCLLYTSPSPRDKRQSRMPSSA